MGLLKAATGGSYLKAGFLGFAGSGKTFTAIDLAIGVRGFFGLPGPIAMFDTEAGSEYVSQKVKAATKLDLMAVKSRSLDDLLLTVKESIEMGVSVLVVDSVTHVWREVCDAYLRQMQARAAAKNWRAPEKLEFQDWGRIKGKWQEWPDTYLNSPLHLIVCGRAGYEYDMEENDRGKKELIKTGIKMKVEGEFGFEPSLLVEMQREFATNKDGTIADDRKTINRAVVLKDRYDVIDGRSFANPTWESFKPHVERLRPADHSTVDTASKTDFGLDEDNNDGRERARRERKVLLEEIEGMLVLVWPGQSAAEKKAKVEAMVKYFGTPSWTHVSERLPAAKLREGIARFCDDHQAEMPPDETAAAPAPAADADDGERAA